MYALLAQEHHPRSQLSQAPLATLFSLGGISRFCFILPPLHAIPSPGRNKIKSQTVSNCRQIKPPNLFILTVRTVLGLVLPGILNRLPLLSGGHSCL